MPECEDVNGRFLKAREKMRERERETTREEKIAKNEITKED